MRYRSLFHFSLLGVLAFSLLGCQQQSVQERYIFLEQEQKVVEQVHDEDNMAKYGVFSDIHGETKRLKVFAKTMQERGVEGFLVLGDTPENDVLRSGGRQQEKRNDIEEMIEAFTLLGKTDLPVFVLPGNHERKPTYETAIKEVTAKYHNIIDLAQYRSVDGDDVDFISLPGYQIKEMVSKDVYSGKENKRKFIPDDGYSADAETITATGKLGRNLDDAVILLTHGPPKTTSSSADTTHISPFLGPGTLYDGSDVGDEATRKMMLDNNLHFALSGHIHEAGGLAATLDGKRVPVGQWAESFILNVGSLEDWKLLDGSVSRGMTAIVTVDGKKAKYETLH